MSDQPPPPVPTPVAGDVPAAEPPPATPPAEPQPLPITPTEPAPPAVPDEPPTPAVPAEPPSPPSPPSPPEPAQPAEPAPPPATPPAAPPEQASPPEPAPPAPPEASPAPVAEDVPASEPAAERRSRSGAARVAAATVAALLVLGALGWLAYRPIGDWRATARTEERRAAALTQARQLALNIGSLDYKNLDRDLGRISSSTTGKAREEFDAKIVKNEGYKTLIRDNQAVLTGTVRRIGLEPCGTDDESCAHGNTAVALVFMDQESKNKLRPTPRVDRNRVALTLVRRGDTWLISDVEVI